MVEIISKFAIETTNAISDNGTKKLSPDNKKNNLSLLSETRSRKEMCNTSWIFVLFLLIILIISAFIFLLYIDLMK